LLGLWQSHIERLADCVGERYAREELAEISELLRD